MKTASLPLGLKILQSVDFPHKLGLLDKLFGRSLAAQGVCWVETAAGILWKLDLTNPTLRWIVYGKYEGSGFLNWAKHFLPINGIIVDSGANIGQMLLYLAQWIPQGTVFAFEPNQTAADWLTECLEQNPTLPVKVIRSGLGASPAQLYLKDEGAASKHGAQSFVSMSEGSPIAVTALVNELTQRAITQVDLWKLDVEGYEVQALKGAQAMLQNKAIRAIYVEVRGENGLLIRDYLSTFGYQYFALTDRGKPYIPSTFPDQANLLFLPH